MGRRRKKTVEETSKALSEVLDQAHDQALAEAADDKPRSPLDWGNANRPSMVPLGRDFAGIIETIVVDDPRATYSALEVALVVGDKRTDYGSMLQHLDQAERNARDAHRLWQTGIIEAKKWEMDNEVVFAAARSEANRSLQAEKDKGIRSKQITDADVDSRIASLFPDEWRAQQHERNRVKAMLASLENLSEVWLSRCRTLQALVAKQR